jgi:hypothetical protein
VSGFSYSAFDLRTGIALPEDTKEASLPIKGSTDTLTAQLSWSGEAELNAKLHTLTIPLEVSTSLQTLYALSVYTGAGIDLNAGSASLAIDAKAPVEVGLINPKTKEEFSIESTNTTFNLAGKGGPTFADIRYFGGLQLNLPLVKFFVQGSMDTTNTLALHLGTRVAW